MQTNSIKNIPLQSYAAVRSLLTGCYFCLACLITIILFIVTPFTPSASPEFNLFFIILGLSVGFITFGPYAFFWGCVASFSFEIATKSNDSRWRIVCYVSAGLLVVFLTTASDGIYRALKAYELYHLDYENLITIALDPVSFGIKTLSGIPYVIGGLTGLIRGLSLERQLNRLQLLPR